MLKDWYFPCAIIAAALCVAGYNTGNGFLTYSAAFTCVINTIGYFNYGGKS